MCRFISCRSYPASLVLAVLLIHSSTAWAQIASQSSAAKSTANPPAPASQIQQPPPTPEQVGDALMTHQRYEAAIEAYKQASPESAAVWNKMGIAHQMMLNSQEAVRCYQSSLNLDPHNPNVLNNLGTIYDSLREYSSAERMYRKALRIDPRSAIVEKNLGTALLAEQKYKKGQEAYKVALSINPQIFEDSANPRVDNPASVQRRGAMNYYMAKSCVHAGQNERAIEFLRMALNEGFVSPKKIAADGEFAALQGIPAFDEMLAAQRNP
jgi:tetratricopeptide (TPR) repeat protein